VSSSHSHFFGTIPLAIRLSYVYQKSSTLVQFGIREDMAGVSKRALCPCAAAVGHPSPGPIPESAGFRIELASSLKRVVSVMPIDTATSAVQEVRRWCGGACWALNSPKLAASPPTQV
jgi:hypothetical protein